MGGVRISEVLGFRLVRVHCIALHPLPKVSVMVATAAAACLFMDQLCEPSEGHTTSISSVRCSLTPA